MDIAIVTGSGGLIGSEAVTFLADKGLTPVGIDNDMRSVFFGADASTAWNVRRLEERVPSYVHNAVDIRDSAALESIFAQYGADIKLVVHAAAQPSHDWAARDPSVDFSVNASGTLNLLELTRRHAPKAVFVFTSTNKVYGDAPNSLPLVERETRWELEEPHRFAAHGIDETMSIDQTLHSLFGVSKLAADVLVQEYGRYFGMYTACLRGGCLTGPNHSGAQLHGFLSYLIKAGITETPYTIFGYGGKQVRDNIHSYDFVNMIWHFFQNPRVGEVYNAGGSRHSNCSIIEAIALIRETVGVTVNAQYSDAARIGDHMWWVSDVRKFQSHYPDWEYRYDLKQIIAETHSALSSRAMSSTEKIR